MKKLLILLFTIITIFSISTTVFAINCPHSKNTVINIQYKPFDDTYSHKLIRHKCLGCDTEWIDDVAILNSNIPVINLPYRQVPQAYTEHHEWIFQESRYDITDITHSRYSIYKCSICKQTRVAFKEEFTQHQFDKNGACLLCGYKYQPRVNILHLAIID